MTSHKITLTPTESHLFSLLQSCATHPPSTSTPLPPIELRIAGGWVRDKLLGLESDDIDVTVGPAPITGLYFATLFEQWLLEQNLSREMGKLSKIDAKPTQSKHLETATAIVCGLSIDWVQQRGHEVYNDQSRIPTVMFGTPLSDSLRRDLTINALFYNLSTSQVEDFTEHGLSDLRDKVIRTPLDPVTTFKDDPLRVVRAVRFASRLGKEWKIDDGLRDAVGRPEIRDALKDGKKISRERVGIELEKMLMGPNPLYALELLISLDLFPLIFLYSSYPLTPTSPPLSTITSTLSLRAARLLSTLLQSTSLHPLLLHPSLPPLTQKRFYLSAALLPLYPFFTPVKSKQYWLGDPVIMEGIKSSSLDKVWCNRAREASRLIAQAVRWEEDEKWREEVGVVLRNQAVNDGRDTKWELSTLWSLVVDLTRHDDSEAQNIITLYNTFVARILISKLDTDAFFPPLLDGKELLELAPTAKGPALAGILNLVIRYQLRNPTAGKEECRSWIIGMEGSEKVKDEIDKVKKNYFGRRSVWDH